MVVTRLGSGGTGLGFRSGSGSGLGSEPIDERLRELIATEVTCDILGITPVIFDTIKEGILELLEEHLTSF